MERWCFLLWLRGAWCPTSRAVGADPDEDEEDASLRGSFLLLGDSRPTCSGSKRTDRFWRSFLPAKLLFLRPPGVGEGEVLADDSLLARLGMDAWMGFVCASVSSSSSRFRSLSAVRSSGCLRAALESSSEFCRSAFSVSGELFSAIS